MQFETDFLPKDRVLMVRALGPGQPGVVEQFVSAVLSAPDFQAGMSVLIDASSTDYLPSTWEAATFPAVFQSRLPGSRLGLVVRRPAQFNVACMVEAISARRFAAFSIRADALQWLTEKQ